MKLAGYGVREWGICLIVTVAVIVLCMIFLRRSCPVCAYGVSAFFIVMFLAVAAFFRVPSRTLPAAPDCVVSPADGVVKDIEVVDFVQPPFGGKALRIGIFLSVLNVHVNCAASDMKVEAVAYREGKYLDARNPDCGKLNEAMTIAGTGTLGDRTFPVAIRQISGAIARRIVCPVEPGRKLAKGEIYGMIKFGSRTELYLPCDMFEVQVKPGDAVHGVETVLAKLK